jgi:hypothetical protein
MSESAISESIHLVEEGRVMQGVDVELCKEKKLVKETCLRRKEQEAHGVAAGRTRRSVSFKSSRRESKKRTRRCKR